METCKCKHDGCRGVCVQCAECGVQAACSAYGNDAAWSRAYASGFRIIPSTLPGNKTIVCGRCYKKYDVRF